MISFDSISNIITLLSSISDDVNENHPELAEKEWMKKIDHVSSYLESVKSLMEF